MAHDWELSKIIDRAMRKEISWSEARARVDEIIAAGEHREHVQDELELNDTCTICGRARSEHDGCL